MQGQDPYEVSDLYLAMSRLTLWTWQSAGLELDYPIVLRRAVIDRFARVGLPDFNEAARGNIRSQLLRMSEVLLDPELAPRRLTPMRAASPSQPYSNREIVSLRGWADSQTTAERRSNVAVLLAAGLGAGLSASEIGNVRVHEIVASEHGVNIEVSGSRPQTVPVLNEWREPLMERIQTLTGDRFVFRENHTTFNDNLISNSTGRVA